MITLHHQGRINLEEEMPLNQVKLSFLKKIGTSFCMFLVTVRIPLGSIPDSQMMAEQ